jgi:hypothetical protein
VMLTACQRTLLDFAFPQRQEGRTKDRSIIYSIL